MAGLDDYQFYTNLRENESPFWQRFDTQFPPSDDVDSSSRTAHYQSHISSSVGDLSPPKSSHDFPHTDKKDINLEKYGEVSITFVSMCAENLLVHPFIVLKRQCQVNVSSHRYHLQPFTLIPAIVHLQSYQGLSALWKGLGSVLTVKGITLGLEDFLSKFTPWPKEISPHSSLKSIGQHLLLKSTALALVTPFYSASLVETIQSDVTSESPGVLDVFKEGLCRLLSFTQPQTGRMLPVWLLVIPTVLHGVLYYILGNSVSTLASQYMRSVVKQDSKKQGALSKDTSLTDVSIRLQSTFMGHLVSDVLLYPLETVLHRLHLQGTRTIIDSLDSGYEVKPILTRYEGLFDCVGTTFFEEGFWGFYKGFGSLVLQYTLHGAILKFSHVLVRQITSLLAPPVPKVTQANILPLAPSQPYSVANRGVASLRTSPLHSARNKDKPQNFANKARDEYMASQGRHFHSNSVDLGDLSDYSDSTISDVQPARRLNEDELRNELIRHRNALMMND